MKSAPPPTVSDANPLLQPGEVPLAPDSSVLPVEAPEVVPGIPNVNNADVSTAVIAGEPLNLDSAHDNLAATEPHTSLQLGTLEWMAHPERGAISLSNLSLRGLSRAINQRRLNWTTKSRDRVLEKAERRRRIAEAVASGTSADTPRTWSEKRLVNKMNAKRQAIVHHSVSNHFRYRLYGRQIEIDPAATPVQPMERFIKPTPVYKRNPDGSFPSDLGTPEADRRIREGDYTRAERRNEKKQNKQYKGNEKHIDHSKHTLHNYAHATDPKSRRYARSVESKNKKIAWLQAKVNRPTP